MPQQSVNDQYRQEAARLRREAKLVTDKLFGAQLIASAYQLDRLIAESHNREVERVMGELIYLCACDPHQH